MLRQISFQSRGILTSRPLTFENVMTEDGLLVYPHAPSRHEAMATNIASESFPGSFLGILQFGRQSVFSTCAFVDLLLLDRGLVETPPVEQLGIDATLGILTSTCQDAAQLQDG